MPKVLLSTTVLWPSAARLAGAFAEAGCAVDALFPARHPLAVSRYPARNFAYRPLASQRSLRAAIEQSRPDLVVPCDDRALTHLLNLKNGRFAALVERSLGTPCHFDRLISRGGFIAAAREAGIAAPETIEVEDEHALDAALERLGLPAVLKVDGSWGGDGVAVARTREEARAAWRRFARPPSRLRSLARAARRGDPHHLLSAVSPVRSCVSLQRYVPGTPATSSFACWRGHVVAANHFDVVMTNGPRGPARVVRRIDDAAMDAAARKLARLFGLSGLHGLDYVRDGGGRAQLIEINPRATQTSHLALGHGNDLAAALVAGVTGRPVAERPAAATGDLIALFPQQWTRNSPWLERAWHDIPRSDPRVMEACLGSRALKPMPAQGASHAGSILNGI